MLALQIMQGKLSRGKRLVVGSRRRRDGQMHKVTWRHAQVTTPAPVELSVDIIQERIPAPVLMW